MKKVFLLGLAVAVLASAARAQSVTPGPAVSAAPSGPQPAASSQSVVPATGALFTGATQGASGSITPVSVTTTSASLVAALGAGAPRRVFFYKNQSTATQTICPSSVATPAVGASGCLDVPAGGAANLCSATFCPSDAFTILGAAAGSGTLEVN